MWKGINQILNRKKSAKKRIIIEKEGEMLTDSFLIANNFNEYFTLDML